MDLSGLSLTPNSAPESLSHLLPEERQLIIVGELAQRRELYFAYGSNMLARRIQAANRAPGAISLGAARLDGHVLVFDLQGMINGETTGGGVANIRQSRGQSLWGVLYWMPPEQLKRLNDLEAGFGYEVLFEPVFSPAFGQVAAYYYRAEKNLVAQLAPQAAYRAYLLDGAKENDLPPDYCQALLRQLDRLK